MSDHTEKQPCTFNDLIIQDDKILCNVCGVLVEVEEPPQDLEF